MSAFIVTHETINIVANAWTDTAGQPLPENHANALGALLWAMNRDAVAQRYAEEEEPAETFRFRRHVYTPAETLKAAHCLRYQCAEGTVPESALYRQLDRLCNGLDSIELRRTAEYEDAPWDFPNPREHVRAEIADAIRQVEPPRPAAPQPDSSRAPF